jgi:hypothetical protein
MDRCQISLNSLNFPVKEIASCCNGQGVKKDRACPGKTSGDEELFIER